MKVIELKDVKKSYGKNEILHGISLDIEEGSIHGLVGRNGCGKTTLIKCLTGIYEQDQGQILVCGEEIFENPKVKAQVGYVADSNQYFEGYHIDEMVEFYKQIYPTFDEKVFRDYNQSIGLDVSKRIKELSKGQAMSLASMLNLSIHPKVMIMDEPMSGLDVIAQKQIKDFIVNEVDMNGMSVLISSHDLKDLESFCDSASMMKDGKILYHGTMDQMKERFTKLQVVFEESRSEIFKELPGVITYSNLGSVYTVILEGYGEPIHEALKQAGAIVVEDEPMSGLDVIAQKQIKDFIVNEVDMNGMSVLISSHDLKDLESFCDSASMMKDGKILYHGTMDQMKERFTKLQVVFEESRSEIFKELPGVITYSNLGSVYTVILEGYGEPIHEALKQAGAIVVEEIPLSLEEVFVYSNR